MTKDKKTLFLTISLVVALGAIIFLLVFFVVKNKELQMEVFNTNDNLKITENNLLAVKNENNDLVEALNNEKEKTAFLEKNLGEAFNAVNFLQKLTQVDPELLKKYSKVYFLNENYKPVNLRDINNSYIYTTGKEMKIRDEVYSYLTKLMMAASSEGLNLFINSAYRSFQDQSAIKSGYKVVYGAGTANQFSAEQGYSEHQLGTTVDFTTRSLKGGLDGFDKTPEYKWLLDNAYKYGFVLSYSEDNKFYVFEPWHWRFVGVILAARLHDTKMNFYDLEQRDIDSYLVNIFD